MANTKELNWGKPL